MTYRLTRRARQDVLAIWNYIAQDSEAAADRFADLLVRHFQLLGRQPQIGRRDLQAYFGRRMNRRDPKQDTAIL